MNAGVERRPVGVRGRLRGEPGPVDTELASSVSRPSPLGRSGDILLGEEADSTSLSCRFSSFHFIQEMLLSSVDRFRERSGSESANRTDLEVDLGATVAWNSGEVGREADRESVAKGLAGREAVVSGLVSRGLVGRGKAGEPGLGELDRWTPYNPGLVHVGYSASGLAGCSRRPEPESCLSSRPLLLTASLLSPLLFTSFPPLSPSSSSGIVALDRPGKLRSNAMLISRILTSLVLLIYPHNLFTYIKSVMSL